MTASGKVILIKNSKRTVVKLWFIILSTIGFDSSKLIKLMDTNKRQKFTGLGEHS